MPKFICKNKDCDNYNKEEYYPRVRYRWNTKLMRLEADESFCSVCGEFRKPVKDYEGWTDAWFKAESNRNYDNKKVKKYDYDHSVEQTQTIKI